MTNKKKNIPTVSIIMNCHNGEQFLAESIQSIINQTYKNWELVIFDNCSTDNSCNIIKRFNDSRIKYYFSKKFLSLYSSRNLAIGMSRGKYIAFCDTDDWWKINKLKKQVNLIEKKNYNVIFSNIYIYNNSTKTISLFFKKPLPNGYITQYLLNDYKLGILTAMINRKIFKKKKFNKKYNIIGDFDFFINLSLTEKFFCDPTPLAYYRNHESNLSKKINLYIKELDDWCKKNFKNLEKLNYSLNRLKFFIYKIKLKRLIGWGL